MASVTHGHSKTTTFVAVVRFTGPATPLVVVGAIIVQSFRGLMRQHVMRTLWHGNIAAINNLGVHKIAGIREAIAAAGARIINLPPHSPEINPILLVFSGFKWLLKSASAWTVVALWTICVDLLGRFPEAECRNCFQH